MIGPSIRIPSVSILATKNGDGSGSEPDENISEFGFVTIIVVESSSGTIEESSFGSIDTLIELV